MNLWNIRNVNMDVMTCFKNFRACEKFSITDNIAWNDIFNEPNVDSIMKAIELIALVMVSIAWKAGLLLSSAALINLRNTYNPRDCNTQPYPRKLTMYSPAIEIIVQIVSISTETTKHAWRVSRIGSIRCWIISTVSSWVTTVGWSKWIRVPIIRVVRIVHIVHSSHPRCLKVISRRHSRILRIDDSRTRTGLVIYSTWL